jgi:integrase
VERFREEPCGVTVFKYFYFRRFPFVKRKLITYCCYGASSLVFHTLSYRLNISNSLFSYDSLLAQKVKTIDSRKWHPKEEVAKILSSVDNLKHKAVLMLVYSDELRVGEVVRLKVE